MRSLLTVAVLLGAVVAVKQTYVQTRTCEAGQSQTDGHTNCAIPNVQLSTQRGVVTSREIKLVNLDGKPIDPDSQLRADIDYDKRGEWVVDFNAKDHSGNLVERISFSLVLADTIPPSIEPKLGSSLHLESMVNNSNLWPMPLNLVKATDAVDGDLSQDVQISVSHCPDNGPCDSSEAVTQGSLSKLGQKLTIDTYKLGKWVVNYTCADHAGIFGHDGKDNVASMATVVTVTDTTPPVLYCKKQNCALAAGAAIKRSLYADYLHRTVEKIASVDDCCSLCEQINATEAGACGFFSFSNTKCDIFSNSLKTLEGNVEPSESAESGFPIGCQVQNSHECGTPYVDPGANCVDSHDSWMAHGVDVNALSKAVKSKFQVVSNVVGLNKLEYTCSDHSGNAAAAKTRYIAVADTTPPDLYVVSDDDKYSRLMRVVRSVSDEDGVTIGDLSKAGSCADACRTDAKDAASQVTTEWTLDGVRTSRFDPSVEGAFVLQYTCTDNAGNEAVARRTIVNEDGVKPIVTLKGRDVVEVDAQYVGMYKDPGATCKSHVDGQIDEAIEKSGDVVLLAKAGTYTVDYSCASASGLRATPATRTVIVRDGTCPTCEVAGNRTVNLEAGFEWTDPSAQCTKQTTTLPTVVEGAVDAGVAGTYVVVYSATDAAGNANDGHHCAGRNVATRTIVVTDTLRPVIALQKAPTDAPTAMPTLHPTAPTAIPTDTPTHAPTPGPQVKIYANMPRRNTCPRPNKPEPDFCVSEVAQGQQYDDLGATCIILHAGTLGATDVSAQVVVSGDTVDTSASEGTVFTVSYTCEPTVAEAEGLPPHYHEDASLIRKIYIGKGTAPPSVGGAVYEDDPLPSRTLGPKVAHEDANPPSQSPRGVEEPASLLAMPVGSGLGNGWAIAAAASGSLGLALLAYSSAGRRQSVPV